MLAKSFHNRHKIFYLGRKPNRRIDDLINLLFIIENDNYMRRKPFLIYSESDLMCSYSVKSRHDRDLTFSDVHVPCIADIDNLSDEMK